MLGLGLVLLFMIVVYRLPGFLADVALAIYVLMLLAMLAVSHATLTLPGIAGFVLSIGMAVDANVLIFERIKEELWTGKTLRAAVRVGFQRAFSTVFDSHFTTIVGAGVLFSLGTGTVKGFAYTLFWGTAFSLFTAVFITRFFVDALVDNDLATHPNSTGSKRATVGIFARRGRRRVLPQPQLEYRRMVPHRLDDFVRRHLARPRLDDLPRDSRTGKASAVHMLRLGLSFTGGTDVTVKFTQPTTAGSVKKALAGFGDAEESVTTAGTDGNGFTIKTQKAFGNDTAPLWKALNTVAPVDRSRRRSRRSVRRFGREYLIKALLALIIALGIQFVYIAFRFGWNYIFGLVTVIALVRDSAMMIGIYALADKRADDAFLAAVLTVIGYSVMDTIVILDRIRENTKLMAGVPFDVIVNESIMQTMTRSFNTLATVVITLVALLALGGASLQNFAFALLVGIVSGGYHSIFYSAPLVLHFRKRQLDAAMKRRREGLASDRTATSRSRSESDGAAEPRRRTARRHRGRSSRTPSESQNGSRGSARSAGAVSQEAQRRGGGGSRRRRRCSRNRSDRSARRAERRIA